ncbi:MAG: hypothetical protein QM493_06375 [Sulfurovum sp.]
MNNMKILLITLLASSLLTAGGKDTIKAESEPLPIEELPNYYTSLKVGTLGVGVDFAIPLTQSLFLRLNVNGAKFDIDTSRESVNYSSTVELLTAGAILDYYPYSDNQFRVSAGAYYYANKVTSHGTPDIGNYNIGGTIYTSAELGSVDVTLDFPQFAPYIGIGYGGKERSKGWNWGIDVGVMYHGDGDLGMSVNRSATIKDARYTTILTDAQIERKNMEDEIRAIPIYPVIMIGLTYSF